MTQTAGSLVAMSSTRPGPVEGLTLRRQSPTMFCAAVDATDVGWLRLAAADGVWEMFSTSVEPAWEGRGIAGALVRFALDAAEAEEVTVIPSCWYVDVVMTRDSPRYDHLRSGRSVPDPEADPTRDACRVAPAVLPQ